MQEEKSSTEDNDFVLAKNIKLAIAFSILLNILIPVLVYKLTGIFNPWANWITAITCFGIYKYMVR
jgi:hypothetical protein